MKRPALLAVLGVGPKGRPSEEDEMEHSEKGEHEETEEIALAKELLAAIKSGDAEAVAEAFEAMAYNCFESFEKEPHEEAPHSERY